MVSWNLCVTAFCEANTLLLLSRVFIFVSFVWECLWLSKPILYNFPAGATKARSWMETAQSAAVINPLAYNWSTFSFPEPCLPGPPAWRWINVVSTALFHAPWKARASQVGEPVMELNGNTFNSDKNERSRNVNIRVKRECKGWNYLAKASRICATVFPSSKQNDGFFSYS